MAQLTLQHKGKFLLKSNPSRMHLIHVSLAVDEFQSLMICVENKLPLNQIMFPMLQCLNHSHRTLIHMLTNSCGPYSTSHCRRQLTCPLVKALTPTYEASLSTSNNFLKFGNAKTRAKDNLPFDKCKTFRSFLDQWNFSFFLHSVIVA